MKGLFFLQRNFAKFGHYIALGLMKEHGMTEAAAFIQGVKAKNFLDSQHDFKYCTEVFENEIHEKAKHGKPDHEFLNKIEKEYGIPNLWPFYLADRILAMDHPHFEYAYTPKYDYDRTLVMIQERFRAIIKMLEEEKPDFIILSLVGCISSMIMYKVAKKMGIKTYIFDHTKLKDYVTMTENEEFSAANKLFDEKGFSESHMKEAEEILKSYREKPAPRKWMETSGKIGLLHAIFKEVLGFVKYVKAHYSEGRNGDFTEQSPFDYLRNKFVKFSRRLSAHGLVYGKMNENEDFVFFPLHFEPERATMFLAPYFTDQIALVHNVAKALPITTKLYVKDHPAMINFRPRSYYDRLKEMPNIVFIDPNVSSSKIIPKAKCVATITGTAGMEAILLGKPVITFGEIFYNKLSFVYHVTDLTKLADVFKKVFKENKHDDKELINFISCILATSFPINYFKIWHDSTPEQIKNSKEIAEFIDYIAKTVGFRA